MSPGRDLLTSTTRGRFRDLLAGSSYGRISAAFQDEGFAPNPESTWDDGSVRRTRTQQYLEAVDWTDPNHVVRALRVFARLMDDYDGQYTELVLRALRRDGCRIDDDGSLILPLAQLPRIALDGLRDPAAILDNLDRIHRACQLRPNPDPAWSV